MTPRVLGWKRIQITVWLLLTLATLLFTYQRFPNPRPTYWFLAIGAVYTLLIVQVLQDRTPSTPAVVAVLAATVVTSFLLRWSMWVRMVAGSGDHIAHIWGRTGHIVTDGAVISSGMYARNPLVHILWASNLLVTDLWLFDSRFVASLVSTMFPLLVVFAAKQLYSLRTSLLAGILTGPFPLLLRTGALFETESIVLVLFVTQLAVIVRLLKHGVSGRLRALLIGLMYLLTYTHAMYPLLILGTFFGVLVIKRARLKTALVFDEPWKTKGLTLAGVGGALLFAFYRVFSSGQGRSRTLRFLSGTSPIPSNILSIFVPTRGAVGESISSGSEASILVPNPVMNWLPVVVLLALAAAGGLYTLHNIRRERKYELLFFITVVISVVTVVTLLLFRSRTSMRIGYRTYYFAGTIGIILAALGLMQLARLSTRTARTGAVIAVILVFLYLTVAPMSTIGNSVDPQFGGVEKGVQLQDQQQLEHMDRYLQGDDKIYPERDLYYNYVRGPFIPRGDTTVGYRLHSAAIACTESDRIWHSDRYTLCLPPD